MKLTAKPFEELTARELYEIYRARTAVFVVEQDCPYQEVDGQDLAAVHVWLSDETHPVLGYLRIYPGEAEGQLRIGRVLTMERGKGYARELLTHALALCREQGASRVDLAAQSYATGLYEAFGFAVTGEEFLEDGIPHRPMTLFL